MSTLLFVGGLGGWEILLIVAIILIFFGAKKIPELARGLGTGIREFKDATTEVKKEIEKEEEKSSHQSTKSASTTESATLSSTPPVDSQVEEVNAEEEERKSE
ncbi:MAG: twin-arginine translocase TatA/TatE family subunit [Cyclobacteriaceae bacterium]|mgnify:CR=1 FL=1